MASRTMKLSHRGCSLLVREGATGRVEARFANGKTLPTTGKSFEAVTNEVRKWLLANAGTIDPANYPKLSA